MTQPTRENKKHSFHFDWIIPGLIKPGATFQKIAVEEKPVWLTPLILISALILLSTLIAAPIQRNTIQMAANIPEDFQNYSVEDQTALLNAQSKQTSPLFLFVFPLLLGLGNLWLSWFILSSLLHLSITLSGSRANNYHFYNLTSWSYLPIALRYGIQILFMLVTQTAVSSPGLSGFIASDAAGFSAFIGLLLELIDIYFIWQVILLFIGIIPLSGLTKSKAWTAAGISIMILMLLQTVPGLISNALSGLSLGSSLYF